MAQIGLNFDFEESYQPIALRFTLDTFDLWHQKENGQKVFLRSMGSGANWLYCHITLFLSLHKYFCGLGNNCKIPSILFLDQPSQVYFPSVLDIGPNFDAVAIAEKQGDSRKRKVDEDIKAVQNLYFQLVKFCNKTFEETGIEPQIIITDHADNLELEDGYEFNNFVKDRWRDYGFIKLEGNSTKT
ncbi:DUF3732 domain-containing protein [bacterium]|nr:MAG: DUF3732 domain-containing protein [bacterium]